MSKTLVLGGPGCGKTTRLLNIMERSLENGVPPTEIAFCTFTNAAADEARGRAKERFGFTDDDLPYFRTLHSLSFREMALRPSDVFGKEHLVELADITGELHDPGYEKEGPATGASADPLLTVDQLARTKRIGLRQAWEENQSQGGDLDWYRLKRFVDAYTVYRKDRNLLDYTDMLERYATSGAPTRARVAILDEAQDLTLLQWDVADRAFSGAAELYAAGDDDQSIHDWAGAASDHFLSLPYAREILPLSHRLPQAVFDISREIVGRISKRYKKDTRSTGKKGAVEWVQRPEEVDLSKGTWLLLARTRYQLATFEAEARQQAVLYSMKGISSAPDKHVRAIKAYETLRRGARVEGIDAAAALMALGVRRDLDEAKTYDAVDLKVSCNVIWHDALIRIALQDREYYLACMRRGEKLGEVPRVRIETIHGAKGAEAENVLLSTDMTWRVKRGYERDPDGEHRVFYVGATRARDRLVLQAPRTLYGYAI
jgi:superfamily I DNA/RNA helicase